MLTRSERITDCHTAQLLCKLQRHDEAVEASVKAYEAVEDGVKAYETFISNILPEGSGRQNFNAASTLLSECSDKLLEARKNNHMEIADKHNGRIREALKLRYDCDEAEISARTDISNETKLELIMVKKNEWSKTEKFVDKAFDLAVDSQATVPDYMTDQVTHYIMHHPVCTESGFSMEETTVLKTMMEPASGGRNPFTGAKLSGDDLRRNNALRDAYTELMDKKNAWEGEF